VPRLGIVSVVGCVPASFKSGFWLTRLSQPERTVFEKSLVPRLGIVSVVGCVPASFKSGFWLTRLSQPERTVFGDKITARVHGDREELMMDNCQITAMVRCGSFEIVLLV